VPIDLTRYRGKVVIIDFWATWCGPCRMSMQHSNELAKRYGDRVVVVTPSLDSEVTQPVAFLKQVNYPFVLVFDQESRRAIRLPFIPARLLLDRRGRPRFLEFVTRPPVRPCASRSWSNLADYATAESRAAEDYLQAGLYILT